MKFQHLIIAIVLLASHGVWAQGQLSELTQSALQVNYESILDSIEIAVEERTTTGTIQAIDLAGRTAIVGGLLYHFGPATDATPLKVRLLGRDFGSLGMLRVGMDLEVIYFQAPEGERVASVLNQIEASDQH